MIVSQKKSKAGMTIWLRNALVTSTMFSLMTALNVLRSSLSSSTDGSVSGLSVSSILIMCCRRGSDDRMPVFCSSSKKTLTEALPSSVRHTSNSMPRYSSALHNTRKCIHPKIQ